MGARDSQIDFYTLHPRLEEGRLASYLQGGRSLWGVDTPSLQANPPSLLFAIRKSRMILRALYSAGRGIVTAVEVGTKTTQNKVRNECRIIREHRVFGREVTVPAPTKDDAYRAANRLGGHAWEIAEVSPSVWKMFIARHEDCYALND